jgi:serine/threonine protein kinase
VSLSPGTQIGKYTVRRMIAEGGMAEIYLCSVQGPEGFTKELVIKRVRAFLASQPSFQQMFIAEARVASQLNHPNLVQIFDFDRHLDTYYLAMEYVRGPSLWGVMRRCRELQITVPPVLAAKVGADIARGLQYAHKLTREDGQPLNLVHRDLTPHNVLLSYDGAVKLADFGIAKASTHHTEPGRLKGKFAYMAPEQARGEETDHRTDIYALGIVLWELVTGEPCFDAPSDVQLLRAVQESKVEPLQRKRPDVSPVLDAAIMKALERDPALRHQTALELERALSRYVLDNADELEDTDLSAFLQKLFPGEPAPGAETRAETLVPKATPATPHGKTELFDPARLVPPVRGSTPVRPSPSEAVEPRVRAGSKSGSGSVPAPVQPARVSGKVIGVAASALVLAVLAGWGIAQLTSGEEDPTTGSAGGVTVGIDAGAVAVAPVDAGAVAEVPVDAGALAEAPVDAGAPLAVTTVDAGAIAEATVDAGPPRKRGSGTLRLRVHPWAELFIDGKSRGEVTNERFELTPGTHRIRLTHPRKQQELTVLISDGANRLIEFNAFQ